MSIYISGTEMPTEGNETIIRILPDGTVLDQYGHHLGLKAIPVPEHGRLIEAEAAKELMKPVDSIREREPEWTWGELHEIYCKELDSLPTIIPIDKEGEE